jgi:2'-5' RNA ligase
VKPAAIKMGRHDDPQLAAVRRVFIAVPLSEDVRSRVAGLVDQIREPGGDSSGEGSRRNPLDVRWVRMDGLHVTLRCLGPTPEDRLDSLKEIVDDVAQRADPFEVALGGAGGFPSPARPRALWLGITAGADGLQRLTHDLNEGLAAVGWPRDERPFKAHLTLARADGVRAGPTAVRRLVEAARGFSAVWRADRLVLFESHTGGGPARYEPLAEARLGVPVRGQSPAPR